MNHVDYFNNPIEIGDVLIRNNNSTNELCQVLRLGKDTRIGISRTRFNNTILKKVKCHKEPSGYKYEKVDVSNTPLWLSYYTIINLSKLQPNQIEDKIKQFKDNIKI